MARRTCAPVFLSALMILVLSAPRTVSAAGFQTYLALGDSMAFGETDYTHSPSYGDRGYVKPFADFLSGSNFDRRPIVINLGVDAETSNTFFQGGPQGDGTLSGHPAPQLNLNYPDASTTQNSLMLSTIASEKAAGHTISTVSVQLGANDLLQTLHTPGFMTLPADQQQALIAQTLGTFQSNYTQLLSELKSELPQATLLLLGYHNPYNADPSSALAQLADPAIKALNGIIASDAAAVGAHYIDTYTPIQGHEADFTYVTQGGNPHPNTAGYEAISGAMQAAVPEPSSLAVFGAGLASLVALRTCRPRAAGVVSRA